MRGHAMKANIAAFLEFDFFRVPSWRWRRAHELVRRGKRRTPRIDDAWVARALHYQIALAKRDLQVTRRKHPELDPVVHAAAEFFAGEQNHMRWRAEALLLTSEPLDRIAEHCWLATDVLD